MKNKIGIIFLIVGILGFAGLVVFSHLQINKLTSDNKEIRKEIAKTQKEIDKLNSTELKISKSEAINTKDVGNSMARIQKSIIKYYPKLATKSLTEKEKIELLKLINEYYTSVDIVKKNDVYLFVDDLWCYNPNFEISYETLLNYTPGKHQLLWKITYKKKLCGIVTAEYDSETQLISKVTPMLNAYGLVQNTKFKGMPKKEVQSDEQEKPDSLVKKESEQNKKTDENNETNQSTGGDEEAYEDWDDGF